MIVRTTKQNLLRILKEWYWLEHEDQDGVLGVLDEAHVREGDLRRVANFLRGIPICLTADYSEGEIEEYDLSLDAIRNMLEEFSDLPQPARADIVEGIDSGEASRWWAKVPTLLSPGGEPTPTDTIAEEVEGALDPFADLLGG